MHIRVVKIGGSLLDLIDLAARLRRWLSAQPAAHHVLIVGGGALVEQVRIWNQIKPIDEVAAHWMCVDLMTVTAHLLHARLPEIALIEDDRLLCQRVGHQDCTIFGPAGRMRNSEPNLPGKSLPASWQVTSDSIAARLAISLNADELVLLKSTLPKLSTKCGLLELSAQGYVDPIMANLAENLPPLRLVNLRQDPPVEREI